MVCDKPSYDSAMWSLIRRKALRSSALQAAAMKKALLPVKEHAGISWAELRGVPALRSIPCGLRLPAVPAIRDSCQTRRVELDPSTTGRWMGACGVLIAPLVEALRRYVLAPGKIHSDDTPMPVLSPGNGQTKTGRLWVYVRDDRNCGSAAPP
jgi:hypothetical protein